MNTDSIKSDKDDDTIMEPKTSTPIVKPTRGLDFDDDYPLMEPVIEPIENPENKKTNLQLFKLCFGKSIADHKISLDLTLTEFKVAISNLLNLSGCKIMGLPKKGTKMAVDTDILNTFVKPLKTSIKLQIIGTVKEVAEKETALETSMFKISCYMTDEDNKHYELCIQKQDKLLAEELTSMRFRSMQWKREDHVGDFIKIYILAGDVNAIDQTLHNSRDKVVKTYRGLVPLLDHLVFNDEYATNAVKSRHMPTFEYVLNKVSNVATLHSTVQNCFVLGELEMLKLLLNKPKRMIAENQDKKDKLEKEKKDIEDAANKVSGDAVRMADIRHMLSVKKRKLENMESSIANEVKEFDMRMYKRYYFGYSSQYGHIHMIKFLYEYYDFNESKITDDNKEEYKDIIQHMIDEAIREEHTHILRYISGTFKFYCREWMLYYALTADKNNIINTLIAEGADVRKYEDKIFAMAITHSSPEAVRMIQTKGNYVITKEHIVLAIQSRKPANAAYLITQARDVKFDLAEIQAQADLRQTLESAINLNIDGQHLASVIVQILSQVTSHSSENFPKVIAMMIVEYSIGFDGRGRNMMLDTLKDLECIKSKEAVAKMEEDKKYEQQENEKRAQEEEERRQHEATRTLTKDEIKEKERIARLDELREQRKKMNS